MSNIEEKPDSPSTGKSPVLIIVAVILVIIIIMAAILYSWIGWAPITKFYVQDVRMVAYEMDDGVWDVTIIRMVGTSANHVPMNATHWYLFDVQGITVAEGPVYEIYGIDYPNGTDFKQGEGKSVIYIDNDYNTKISTGDDFSFYPGEGDSLANVTSLDDYSFRIKFAPTDDNAAYDVIFTDEAT